MWTAAGERVSTQEIFKKDSSQEVRALYQKHAMGNSLLQNRGAAFDDATISSGVGMGRWAWSSDAFDFDHDGFPDLYIANGMVSGPSRANHSREDLNSFFWRQVVALSPDEARASHDYEQGWNAINELIRSDGTWSGYERNVFYANNRDGTFSDVSGVVGLDFVEDGRSFALADFDHDGRLEAVPEESQRSAVANSEERHGGLAAARSRSVCRARRATATRSAPPSRLKPARAGRRACFRPDRVSFRSTAKMFSSDSARRKVRCERQFAGPAAWCRNSTTFPSITGSGWKKAQNPRAWSRSRQTATKACPDSRSGRSGSRATSSECGNLASGACCRSRFFASRSVRENSCALRDSRQAGASPLLDDEVTGFAGPVDSAPEILRGLG